MKTLGSLLLFVVLISFFSQVCVGKKPDSPPGGSKPKPDPEPDNTTLFFRYAEIPEIVFVEGYADTEDMAIYHLNTNNLFPAGHMPWEKRAHNWTPKLQSTLIGSLPSGISYDPLTGIISYDGSDISDDESYEVQFTQSDTSQTSDVFKIKVLKPDLVWDGSGATLNDAIALMPKLDNYNVVLIKGGKYTIDQLHPNATGYMGKLQNRNSVYIIGEPGNMPSILEARTSEGPAINWKLDNTIHSYFKNLDIGGSKFSHKSLQSFTLNNIKFHSNYGVDGMLANNMTKDDPSHPVVFISNFETFHYGSDYSKHPVYAHMRYEDTSNQGDGYGSIFVNNYKAYSTVGGTKLAGGHAFKAITKVVKMRNFWISQSESPKKPLNSRNSETDLISLHSYQKVVLFNGVLNNWLSSTHGGSKYAIIFQNRGMNALGNDDPPYFSSPNQLEIPDDGVDVYGMWPDWDIGIKNPVFHGVENAADTYTYSLTGLQPVAATDPVTGDIIVPIVPVDPNDLEPNSTPPSAAPFWDTVGDVSDPTNDELTYHKYISYVEFNVNSVPDQWFRDVAIDQRGTEPKLAIKQFATNFDYFSVPPNWKERTHLFTANNHFNGYKQADTQSLYQMDFAEPTRYIYPYAPNTIAPEIIPREHTNQGGDIIDDTGSSVDLPEWFKI